MAPHTTGRVEQGEFSTDSTFDRILDYTLSVSAILLLLQSLVMIVDIIYSAFRASGGFFFTNPIARILLLWIAFLTIALHARDDDHIRVKYFYNKFPDRAKRVFDISETLFNVLFAVVITVGTASVISSVFGNTTAEGFPLVLIYLPLLTSCILLTLVFSRQFVLLLNLKQLLSKGEKDDG